MDQDQNPHSDETFETFQEFYECPSTHPEKFGYSSPPPTKKFICVQFMAESHLSLSELKDKLSSDRFLNLKNLLLNTFLQGGLIESEDDGVFLGINVNEKVQLERN